MILEAAITLAWAMASSTSFLTSFSISWEYVYNNKYKAWIVAHASMFAMQSMILINTEIVLAVTCC